MSRLIDLGGLAGVIVWTLFSIAGHGLIEAMSSWLATAPLPDLISATWSAWLAGILDNVGTAIAIVVWGSGLMVILAVTFILRRLFGRAQR